MPTRAVVLSGGGPVGIAWESALAAGLAGEGLDLREADFFVGTSAGSFVGAQLALGREPESLVAAQMARAEGGAKAAAENSEPAPDLTGLMAVMAKLYTSDAPAEELRREVGAYSLAATTIDEDAFIKTFGYLPDAWPERRYACTAVDTTTGEFQVWDNGSGVSLRRAIASSCSVPGIYPPITINGKRYMDGGMRSGTNADVAKGYDRVLVISVRYRPGAPVPAGRERMAEASRMRFEEELAVLRDGGSQVEVLAPDDESAAAMGVNLMAFSARAGASAAGLRQGKLEVARLRSFWT